MVSQPRSVSNKNRAGIQPTFYTTNVQPVGTTSLFSSEIKREQQQKKRTRTSPRTHPHPHPHPHTLTHTPPATSLFLTIAQSADTELANSNSTDIYTQRSLERSMQDYDSPLQYAICRNILNSSSLLCVLTSSL